MQPDHTPLNPPLEDDLTRVQRLRREATDSAQPMTDVELEQWRQDHERRAARKYMGMAIRNLLLWVVAVVGATLTLWDVVIHIFHRGPK